MVAAPAAARRRMAFADAIFVGVGSSQLGSERDHPGRRAAFVAVEQVRGDD
jgi:hypothetical protein